MLTVWLGKDPRTGARVGREGPTLVVEWPGVGRLRATNARDGSFERFAGANPAQCAKIEQGVVPGLLRTLDGKTSLHAAAVSVDGRAIVLIGDSGAGKSTLAAAMVRAGGELLADDITALEQEPSWSVSPSEAAHFLDVAASGALTLTGGSPLPTGKAAIAARNVARRPAPLAAIVQLAFEEGAIVLFQELRPMEAMSVLLQQSLRLALDDLGQQRLEVDTLARLAEEVPFRRLVRPRSFELLERTAQELARLA